MKKKILNLQPKTIILNFLNKFPVHKRCFLTSQLFHKKGQMWTKMEKKMALSLYYKSPKCYKFLRNSFQLTLPSVGTIRSWLKLGHLKTGVDETLFSKLKCKVAVMTEKEKLCTLMFDEMSIRRGLQYNSTHDKVEGYEDLGSLGRNPNIGNQALVFMVRGLFEQWKMPVSYFIVGGSLNACNLKKIIVEIIHKLKSIGLKIRAIVCDQQSTNRATFKALDVSAEAAHFQDGNEKIYCVFDVPHLVKSFRNTLMKHDIYDGERKVSWNDIVQAYHIDAKCKTASSLCKITSQHIYPNSFQKMKVKLATQVFSNRMSAAIKTAVATNELKSQTALYTAEFIKKINDLFDALNSNRANDSNPNACAISNIKPYSKKILEDATIWIPTLKVLIKTGKESKQIYCFNGLLQSVNACLNLWSDLHDEGYSFLITSRLNQDPLENLFAALRNRCGDNANPTAAQFRIALQHNIFNRLMEQIEGANCAEDEDFDLNIESTELSTNVTECNAANIQGPMENETLVDDNSSDKEETSEETLDTHEKTISENLVYEEDTETDNSLSIEACSVTYVAGYLAYKNHQKLNCKECTDIMTAEHRIQDLRNMLILFRDYGNELEVPQHLKVPSEMFRDIVELQLKVHVQTFSKIKCSLNIKATIRKIIIDTINKKYPEWLILTNNCHTHRMFILDFLIKMKMNFDLKLTSREFLKPSKRKENIVQHK